MRPGIVFREPATRRQAARRMPPQPSAGRRAGWLQSCRDKAEWIVAIAALLVRKRPFAERDIR